MPHGVYDRSLYPRSHKYRRNPNPEYAAWKRARLQENRAARAIRDEAMRKISKTKAALAALNEKEFP
jgi:hypothetical protein